MVAPGDILEYNSLVLAAQVEAWGGIADRRPKVADDQAAIRKAVRVIGLVHRQQGLLVCKGNPKGIRDLTDLEREDIRFINRQRGAGTRVLPDYQLDLLGISKIDVSGYADEEFTHLTVGAAVASGRADCGMGIAAAAAALELDFLPLFDERYDLIVPEEFYNSDLLAPLWVLLDQPEFRQAVLGLPGYNIDGMNTTIALVE